MNPHAPPPPNQRLPDWVRLGAGLLVFVALQVFVEEVLFFKLLAGREDRVTLAIWYQKILTSTSRSTKPRFTTVVQVNDDPRLPRSADKTCPYRGYIASLIDGVAAYQPRAILVDMVFAGNVSCDEDTALRKSLQNACEHMPVVVGAVENPEGTDILSHIHISDGPLCSDGLINLADDSRQVSLVAQIPPRKNGSLYPTIAWQTAKLVSPGLEHEDAVVAHIYHGEPLFSTLFEPDDFRPGEELIPAAEIALPHESPMPLKTGLIQRLRGKIAVIGSREEQKLESHIGAVHGHLLQASYLEAILDGRLWQHLSRWIEIPAGILFWFAVEFPGLRWRTTKSKRMLTAISLAVIIVGTLVLMALNTLIAVFWGYYGEFAAISLASIVVWGLSQISKYTLHAFLAATLLVPAAPLAFSQDAAKGVPQKKQTVKTEDKGASKANPPQPERGPAEKRDSNPNPNRPGGLVTALQKACGPDWHEDRCEGKLARETGSTLIHSFGQRLSATGNIFTADWTCPSGEAESPVRLKVRTPNRSNVTPYAMITVKSCGSARYTWPVDQFRMLEENPARILMTLELVPNPGEVTRFLNVRLSVPGLAESDPSPLLKISANRPFKSFQLAPDEPVLQGEGTQFGTRVIPLTRPAGSSLKVCPVWDGIPKPCEASLIY